MYTKLKNAAVNFATAHVADIISGFNSNNSQKDSGKVAAKLLSKSPFEIPEPKATEYGGDPLKFGMTQYPLDLGSNELGHYILFESGFVGYSPQVSGFRKQRESTFVAGKEQISEFDFDDKKITAKLPNKSITTSGIAIYMPPGIKVSYNQSYDADIETGVVGDFERGFKAVAGAEGAANKIDAALKGVVGSTARKAKEILGEFVSLAGVGDPVRFAAKRGGFAVNPRSEAFYNSPQQRTFSFTFDFWPRTAKEASVVNDIIGIFKYNSAPGLNAETLGGVFNTPNYFKISYMHNTRENANLNRIGACYCTDVEVDFSPDGQFTTFGDGHPVHTKLTVNFIEDRIITKQDITAGA